MTDIFNEKILVCSPEEEITVSSRKIRDNSKIPPYTQVGRTDLRRGKPVGYPLVDTLLSMNKGEQWMYGLIHKRLDYKTNCAELLSQEVGKTNLPKLSIAYKSLRSKGLIKRVRKEYYMVNPEAVFHPAYYESAKEKWDSLP